MNYFCNKDNLLYKTCVIFLIFLHLFAFGPIRDALAYNAQSASYQLSSGALTQGGKAAVGVSAKIWQATLSEPVSGKSQSQSYILNAGFIPTIASNPPAQIQIIPNFAWQQNESKTNIIDLDDYFTSPDGYPLIYTVTGNSNINVVIDVATNQVTFSQSVGWSGTEKIKFKATDSEGSFAESNEITLQVVGVNNPPVLDYIPDITVNENELIKIIPHATDADGDVITYTFSAPLNSDGQWQTDYASSGIYTITVTAADPENLTDTQEVKITVKNVNRPPVLNPISDITVNEGQTAVIAPTVSDPDNDAISLYYSAPFDSQGKWITGYNDSGTYNITVTASDGIDTVTQNAKVIVTSTNRIPQVTLTLSKYTVTPNEQFNVVLSATDPDGDAMTFSLKKDGVEIASGNFNSSYTTTISFADVGDHEISGRITDSGNLTVLQTKGVDVAVADSSVNPVMGDFNGDALTDLGLHNSSTGKWEICLSDKGVFRNAVDWLTGFGNSSEWLPLSGDFNGDAKSDVAAYNFTTGELKVALSNSSGFSASGTWFTVPSPTYQKEECRSYEVCSGFLWFEECEQKQECYNIPVYPLQPFTGNFNADKYTDFGIYNKETGEVKIALGTGSGFGPLTVWLASSSANTEYITLGGDFNGDSLGDLCLFKKSTGEFKIAFSNSASFVDETSWISGYAANQDVTISDFNNDGLADIGYWDKPASKWYYAISTGNKFVDKGVWLSNFGSSGDDSATTGDFNGDGITDAACFDKEKIGIDRWLTQLSTNKPADLLTEIDNGIGGKTEVVYTYASQYDNDLLPFPVYVASSISLINTVRDNTPVSVTLPETYTQNFNYAGGYFDAIEREFRGFARITVTDPITNNYSETYFYQGKSGQDGALKGQIEKIIAYDGNGKLISQSLNTYEVKKATAGENCLGFPALIEQTATVYEENATSLSTKNLLTYDNIGNVIETKNEGDISKTGDEKIATITYSQAFEAFNRPIESLLKDKDGNVITKKTAEYDDRGNLSKETIFILNPLSGISLAPSTLYSYDSFGNLISTTDTLGRSVTTEYDTDFYAYPLKVINNLGHTVTQTYNYKFGVVTSVTDTNGHTSQTFYDSLARVTSAKNAYNETVITYSYPDFNTKITTNALGHSKTEYIDGLGRAYKAVSVGEDGASARQVSSETYYNNRGAVSSESLPHYIDEDASQISYVRYEYDIRGRVKKTISDFPGTLKDAQASISYINPLYIETTDPEGHKKGTLKDVYGNNIEITEFTQGGVYKTNYEYDIQNNLVKLIDSKGNITQIFYDSIGRKLKMIDPDMGTWLYEYDILGNLTKQTDAKNQIITFAYDELNRLTKKTKDNGAGTVDEINYLYDDNLKENCIGRLSKVTDTSGSTEFFYDKLGREIKSIKRVSGIEYQVSRTYDILDRLSSLTYPDNTVINYSYDANSGLLEKVSNSTNTINYVNSINYNAKGQIRDIIYGNNTKTDYTYGQDLRLSNILTTNYQLQTTLQDLNYIFDKNGNITTLTDNKRSNIRTYTYDELNRLTQASNVPAVGGGYTTFNYQYDSIGNMTYKSDLGVMAYGQNAGPHAVTSAGGYTYQYDANGNMTVGKNKTLEYDAENRLTKVIESTSTSTFTYDGDGGRVKKAVSSQTSGDSETIYIGSLYELTTESGQQKAVKHIFAGSTRVCSLELDATRSTLNTNYYHGDHLGSSNVITDANGQLVQYCEYTPYGTLARNEGANITNYKFTGKELDSTGLYFYGARYYDPEIGRFITADTITQAPFNPQTLNRYSYCGNNPINYIDPTGHWFWFAIAAVFIGAASGAAISAITGGDIGAGAICGAISGALFFAAGSAIGGLATALAIQEGTAAMTMLTAGIHTIAGAMSGALGAVATGGNPGMSAVIGGLSAGVSAGVSGIFPIQGKGFDAFVGEGLQRTTVGAILGGGISLAMGGTFGAGAAQGAMTSSIAYIANCTLHKVETKVRNALNTKKPIVLASALYNDDDQLPIGGPPLMPAAGYPAGGGSSGLGGAKVYRVWGGGSGSQGRSWTTVNPQTVPNFRGQAGLPPQNTGRFVSEGTITNSSGVTVKSAEPIYGNPGGLTEVVIPDSSTQVRLERVSGANPEY
ncbi:MAG: hypothetical protein M0R48_02055 [Candidatus Omnitrophica bacterium]|jgi:uncharacterized protein RhaS with RHS repeats|nr:hypothetical protein [Candidatus Omnitrophota bacterium]